jgi:hypothetical protein
MSGVAAADNEGIIGGFPLRWLRRRDGIDGAALLTSFSSYKPGAPIGETPGRRGPMENCRAARIALDCVFAFCSYP